MDSMILYPQKCRKSIRRLTDEIGMSSEVAYDQILIIAALMDLKPEDDAVVHMILQDCGLEVE